ncbi:hypothetical protein B0T19DRAFT_387052 [Cercophora scortea]|uniref:TauD/TfdA-like domain-containing protein n=1 Tax=Cercophora scortea TaxID=314031 RepID=A0AAE0M772_9PEZI|nr:hypothetical protein B0T19DRAFT_387052 [Cercophora scortea]
MDFSRKDLEDIQRVAGLLDLTVDELLQQRRRPSEHRGSHSSVGSRPPIDANHTTSTQPIVPQFAKSSHLDLRIASHNFNNDFVHVDHSDLDEGPHAPTGTKAASSTVTDPETEVILLNPANAWYDCNSNAEQWAFDESSGGNFSPDDINMSLPDDDDELDGRNADQRPSPMLLGSDNVSDFTAAEDTQGAESGLDGAGTDWALVSSSPGSTSMSSFQTGLSPSTAAGDRRYPAIAPRSERVGSQALTDSSTHRVRKKRSPYQGAKKIDTHLTRQVHACVRCRMQRNRCIPDPSNPRGPCLTCQLKVVRMSRLPCLRYMITDSTLFRTGLDYMPFYRSHPMIGPHYGDFYLKRYWTNAQPQLLRLGQLQGDANFQVELREFVPPPNSADVDLKGRPMYKVPWAIADPDAAVIAINNYIERSIVRYLYEYLDDTDGFVWDIFQNAYRASVFPTPNRMLQKTLRLWVACRFLESKWRCWTDYGKIDDPIIASNPRDPFYDWTSLPPYLDYQIASIIIERILTPLRRDVLRELQSTLNVHDPKDWYTTFLTCFILLQNYEMQMHFQCQFAARRNAKVRYLDMPLVRATNSGAKTILAHFHYCFKGQALFTQGFDWNSPKVCRMARLDAAQTSFMGQCRDLVVTKAVSNLAVEPTRESLTLKPNVSAYIPRTTNWPTVVEGDIAWEPTDFTSEQDYTLVLSSDEISEVEAALEHFCALGLYGNEVSPINFPLPTLGPKLIGISLDIHRGKGFAVIRGLDPEAYSAEDNALIFLGISSYIAGKRGRQDEDGSMMMHIRDAKLSRTVQGDRPIRYSSRASTFHTDTFSDILALQTRSCAAEGGRNILASSSTIYNKLMASHPHLRELLAQPIWPFDSRGKLFECSTRPLLYQHGGHTILNFAREPLLGLTGIPRTAGLNSLTQTQRDALDVLEQLATEAQLVVDAQPGDLLFVNNHGLLHSREAFVDTAEATARYLVRMWLKNPALAWKLPKPLQEGNARVYEDNELGEKWNIADVPRVEFRLSERLTS